VNCRANVWVPLEPPWNAQDIALDQCYWFTVGAKISNLGFGQNWRHGDFA
jgi:hypothetical protein